MLLRVCFLSSCALAAAWVAHAEPSLLDLGYGQMYNLDFDGAHRTFAAWQAAHPDDPLAPASDAAAYLFSEFDRLHILQSEFFVQDDHFFTDRRLMPDPALKPKVLKGIALAKQARKMRVTSAAGTDLHNFSLLL